MKRDKYIDIVKGIGIILVVLAHTLRNNLSNIIYYFHMPLFFMITGMTLWYSYKKELNIKDLLIKKTKSLLIPYLFYSLLFFLYWTLIERNIRNQLDVNILSNFINIFIAKANESLYSYNIAMWFLPCLFTSEIIFHFLLKAKNKIIILLILFILGYLLTKNNIFLPFGLEIALMNIIFIYLGYLLNKNNIINKDHINLTFTLLSFVFIGISYNLNHRLDLLKHIPGKIILFIVAALSGIYIIFQLAKLIKNIDYKNLFSFLGQNTLIIMCVHEPLKRIFIKLFSVVLKINESILRANIVYSLLITFTVILFIIIVKKFLTNVINHLKLKFNN